MAEPAYRRNETASTIAAFAPESVDHEDSRRRRSSQGYLTDLVHKQKEKNQATEIQEQPIHHLEASIEASEPANYAQTARVDAKKKVTFKNTFKSDVKKKKSKSKTR